MKSLSKLFATLAITACAFTSFSAPLEASYKSQIEQRLNNLEMRVNLLEMEQVVYGPITASNISLNNVKHFAVVNPGQVIECSFDYKLDSDQQEFLEKNYLLVGLQGVACETSVMHSRGFYNATGKAKFNLTAPLAEGDYEVKIAYRPANSEEEAMNSWNVLGNEPDSNATIGILRVHNLPCPCPAA